MSKEYIPLDELDKIGLCPYELVTVAAKEARNINKVRLVEKEQNPDMEPQDTIETKVYVEALEKVINGEIEAHY